MSCNNCPRLDECAERRACQRPPLNIEDYTAIAIPRLAAIDRLAARIDFSTHAWLYTDDGERYQRLIAAQSRDEVRAGL